MDQTFVSYESSCLLNLRLLSSDASSVSLIVYMPFLLVLNKIFPENVTVETFMMRDKLRVWRNLRMEQDEEGLKIRYARCVHIMSDICYFLVCPLKNLG